MRVAVLGSGNVGQALGLGWTKAGHEVAFGSRSPDDEKAKALVEKAGGKVQVFPHEDAARAADVVVLALPFGALEEALKPLAAALAGKVLIDATNPVRAPLPEGIASGAEAVASWVPGARVVKAFNTTGAETMAEPRFGELRASMLLCGDDAQAREVAKGLARDLGFDDVDAGALSRASLLEGLARLWITLAMQEGHGRGIAFSLLRRA
jgi:8-hydroxy-5-deazaflavin:NADPH oxidoreductase